MPQAALDSFEIWDGLPFACWCVFLHASELCGETIQESTCGWWVHTSVYKYICMYVCKQLCSMTVFYILFPTCRCNKK